VKPISIALDGYSSCGKSTLAKQLAKNLGFIYVDTGAMYRAVTLFALEQGYIDENQLDKNSLLTHLSEVQIHFKLDAENHPITFLNGENVESKIRSMKVSGFVSQISAIKEVRVKMVELQQEFGKNGGVVMDGRDIGTVVLPDAELKIFMTAENEVRAQRRWEELQEKGQSETFEAVLENLQNRDHLDTTREESPLIQAEDAVVLDNTNLTREEQLDLVLKWVDESSLD
jgi:CMP/dCMP kinase